MGKNNFIRHSASGFQNCRVFISPVFSESHVRNQGKQLPVALRQGWEATLKAAITLSSCLDSCVRMCVRFSQPIIEHDKDLNHRPDNRLDQRYFIILSTCLDGPHFFQPLILILFAKKAWLKQI